MNYDKRLLEELIEKYFEEVPPQKCAYLSRINQDFTSTVGFIVTNDRPDLRHSIRKKYAFAGFLRKVFPDRAHPIWSRVTLV